MDFPSRRSPCGIHDIFKKIIRHGSIKNDKPWRLIDVGCGSGSLLAQGSIDFDEVVGIDRDDKNFKKAAKRKDYNCKAIFYNFDVDDAVKFTNFVNDLDENFNNIFYIKYNGN